MVDALPRDPADYPELRVGDQGIKSKRWYVEGYERFDDQGALLRCDPKGIEIRTRIHPTVDAAVAAVRDDLRAAGGRDPAARPGADRDRLQPDPLPLRGAAAAQRLGAGAPAGLAGGAHRAPAHDHLRARPEPVLRRAGPGRAGGRRPQADPLQPLAGAAVVLLAVPGRRGLGRAVGAHRDPHRRPAGRAGLPGRRPAAGRGRPVADPGGPDPGRGGPHRVQGVRRLPGPDALRRAAQPAHRAGAGPDPARPADHPGRRRAPRRRPGRAGRRRGARRHRRAAHRRGSRAGRPGRRPGPAGRPARPLGAPGVPGHRDARRLARGHPGGRAARATRRSGAIRCRSARRPGSCRPGPRRRSAWPRRAGSRRGRRTA